MANKDAFRRVYIGGEDPYKISFNTTYEDLKPTSYFIINHEHPICCFCGEPMKFIQNVDCDVIGYCCICDDAEKEISLIEEYEELLKKQRQERQSFEKKFTPFNYRNLKNNIVKHLEKIDPKDLLNIDIQENNEFKKRFEE